MFIKKDVATEPVEIKYLGFEIGPEFVVGYGLDYEGKYRDCLLYTSPSPRDRSLSRMPSSA